jgi:methyltransferase
VIVSIVVIQRLVELAIASNNTKYAYSLGGYEIGHEHYPFLVILHICFFVSLVIETLIRGNLYLRPITLYFIAFIIAQTLRIWCILSLGRRWNTRILVIPGSKPVTSGPYRFIRHPNYLVVITEIVSLPLSFGAPVTAAVFSILNLTVLKHRVRVEEEGLKTILAFKNYFEKINER